MSHARNETSAPYQHPDTRNSLEALVLRKWEGILVYLLPHLSTQLYAHCAAALAGPRQ